MNQAQLNAEARSKCNRFLSGHQPRTQRDWLMSLADSPVADTIMDRYSEGPAIQALEQQVAQLLGKPAAMFVPKGIIAQQIALRVWSDRRGCKNIGLHPKSHIDIDERNAYERLHNLSGVRLGKDNRPFELADLKALHEPLGALTVELPLRRAGYKLPAWDELSAISDWCREAGIPLHFDGARLWESAAYYQKSYAEISALADSVYVSFYKGLGGMGGCILAGQENFIAEAAAWRMRMGGNHFTIFPYVISAIDGLAKYLPRMETYFQHATGLAARLSELPGITIVPSKPHTNAFQIYLPHSLPALQQANLKIAHQDKLWLFGYLEETALPGVTMAEISVGEATLELTGEEIEGAVQKLLELCPQFEK